MRILVLSNLYPPDFFGGYELGCRQAVEALTGAGHEVRVLTSAPRLPVPPEPDVQRVFQLTDVYMPYLQSKHHAVTLHLEHARACFVNAFNVHALLEALAAFEPDVVYVWNLIGLGGLGLMACLQHQGVPWVWHLMDRVPRDLCSLPDGSALPLAGIAHAQLEGTYLTCSRRVAEEIDEPSPLLRGTVELLPNWIAGPRPSPRRTYFTGGHLRIVSAAAHLCEPKGIHLILEAARLLRDQGHTNFSMELYGAVMDGVYPALVEEHGLGGCVTLKGLRGQQELAEVYARSDVFAFPTWEREPFAFAPLEAAARGCVPFLTDNCGNSEWLVHRVHCWKIERTAEALADALTGVLDGRIDLAAIGRRVEGVVWRDFHIDSLRPRLERALERAARQRRSSHGGTRQAYHLALLAEKLTQVLVEEMLVG
jgi:glycogen(starch) synthase